MNRIIACLQNEKRTYRENKNDVNIHNRKMLTIVLLVSAVSYTVLLCLSMIHHNYARLFPLYLISILYAGISLFFVRKFQETPVRLLCYGMNAAMILFCIYSSAFLTPQTACSRVLIFIMLFPVLIYDSSVYIDTAEILFSMIYLAVIAPFKMKDAFVDEVVNVASYSIMALILGHYIRWNSVNYFTVRRQQGLETQKDALTGLFRYQRLHKEMRERTIPPFALVAFHVEGLWDRRRWSGIEEAEAYLRRLGECFSEIQETERMIFYSYGGSEFLASAERNFQKGLFQSLVDVYRTVSELESATMKESEGITLYIGAAYWNGTLESTLGKVDRALNFAQCMGQNRIVIYDDMEGKIKECFTGRSDRKEIHS